MPQPDRPAPGLPKCRRATNKIVRFEETGDIDHRLFRKLAAVLFVDRATIKRLMEKDRREFVQRWHEWANRRIRPHLIEEVAPGLYMVHCFPEDVTTSEQMESYASDLAGTVRQPIWLIFSRKLQFISTRADGSVCPRSGTRRTARAVSPVSTR